MRGWGWIVIVLIVGFTGPIVWAQTALTGTTPGPSGETAEWGSSVVWAFLASSALEWIKRNQRIAVLSDRTAFGAQRVLGIVLAIATAAGIHVSFEASTGVLTITGLMWDSIWNAGGESLRQWVFQEITYRAAVKDFGRKPGEVHV
jgi:hypothetical protein